MPAHYRANEGVSARDSHLLRMHAGAICSWDEEHAALARLAPESYCLWSPSHETGWARGNSLL